MPSHPATRALAVLELLQTHGSLSGAELAARLEVDRRTVRRYIAMLEEMGIPITTERGRLGCYQLVAGYKLPPMMFTYDEAVALSLGLAAARGFGLLDSPHAVAGAQAKLERVMPPALKERVRSIAESVSFSAPPRADLSDSTVLSLLSTAAHARRGVRVRYRAQSGEVSERELDPYGLAFQGGRWYTVGYCHLRKGLRSFRLDRIEGAEPLSRPFQKPEPFDVMAHLAHSIATLPRRFAVTVILRTTLESAQRTIFPSIGILEPHRDGVTLHSQADDLDWFARELAAMPWAFQVVRPQQLKTSLKAHSRRLLAACGAR